MAELPNRDELEENFARKFGKVARRHMHEFRELLGNPPDLANVPEEFWERMKKETERETYPILLMLFGSSALLHGWSGSDAGIAAIGWATMRSQEFGEYWTESTRTRIYNGFEKLLNPKPKQPAGHGERTFDEASETNRLKPRESPARTRPGETRPIRPESPDEPSEGQEPHEPHPNISRDDLMNLLDKTFGPKRIERTVIIETTKARSAGGEAGIEATVGLSEQDIWCNPQDQNTCKICFPLIGKTRSVWMQVAPDGPPPDESECRCRCGISYEADRIRDGLPAVPDWGPKQWAEYWKHPESRRSSIFDDDEDDGEKSPK